ncbi:MAG: hypothetical protein II649_00845 [Kiritimatiellae bacterium]|nr:hypothetical protein [Kiritimatiellia bacterium]
MKRIEHAVSAAAAALLCSVPCAAARIADFAAAPWGAPHHVSTLATTPQGQEFTVAGEDPWLESPVIFLDPQPDDADVAVFSIELAKPVDSALPWQIYWNGGHGWFNEERSFTLYPAGKAPYSRFETRGAVRFPAMKRCKLRLDPPGGNAKFAVKSVSMEYGKVLWDGRPAVSAPAPLPDNAPVVLAGRDWRLLCDLAEPDAFRFESRGKSAENIPGQRVAYVGNDGKVHTLGWKDAKASASRSADGLAVCARASVCDVDGRIWSLRRDFVPTEGGTSLTVSTEIRIGDDGSEARIVNLPALTLAIDRKSRGWKRQAMLAGVEYLDDEPSSNKKEISTAEHDRTIPASHCISAPLAVFTDNTNFLSVAWGGFAADFRDNDAGGSRFFATVFDTPDRVFKSGGHLLAFWAPQVGPARRQSSFKISAPVPFRRARLCVTLRTGQASSVADALESCLALKPLPPPDRIDIASGLHELAAGWLDSQIRNGTFVKHAIGGSFKFGRPADAPVLMEYLASAIGRHPFPGGEQQQYRLREVAAQMRAEIPDGDVGVSTVSHIRLPAPPLVRSRLPATWIKTRNEILKAANMELASGMRTWKPAAGKPDYGKTLGDTHCNGYTSIRLLQAAEAAVWSGDEAEIAKFLAIVEKVARIYNGTVPRGGQPWEMPLHTPDIMPCANLVRVFCKAYMLKPDWGYIREARHWAFAGLSMVCLEQPPFDPGRLAEPEPVGRYGTIAVMGATNWVAPNWIGRPVQWCGLVYAAALRELARLDRTPGAKDFWTTVASGITASGLRQNHTAAEPHFRGLLPDSWDPVGQTRFPIPINPGTVQENLAEDAGLAYYSERVICPDRRLSGALLHVAGNVKVVHMGDKGCVCEIDAWPERESCVALTRTGPLASAKLNGKPLATAYDPAMRVAEITIPPSAKGTLVLELR